MDLPTFSAVPRHVSEDSARAFVCMDMHVHTSWSKDAVTSVATLVERAGRQGIGFAVTDHNEIGGALEAWRLAGEVPVVPGIELKAEDGVDIIAYFRDPAELERFYVREVEQKKRTSGFFLAMTEEEIIDAATGYHCLLSAPHPFAPRRLGLGGVVMSGAVRSSALRHIDLIETVNGSMSKFANRRAMQWASDLGKPVVAGSDAHAPWQIGSFLTCIFPRADEGVLDALVDGRSLLLSGKKQSWHSLPLSFLLSQVKVLTHSGGLRIYSRMLRCCLDMQSRTGTPSEEASLLGELQDLAAMTEFKLREKSDR